MKQFASLFAIVGLLALGSIALAANQDVVITVDAIVSVTPTGAAAIEVTGPSTTIAATGDAGYTLVSNDGKKTISATIASGTVPTGCTLKAKIGAETTPVALSGVAAAISDGAIAPGSGDIDYTLVVPAAMPPTSESGTVTVLLTAA